MECLESRFELDPDDLRKQEKRLGQGHYGEVWVAHWRNQKTQKRTTVAMKTAKASSTSTSKELQNQIKSIRKEIEILAYVGEHEYILQLVGAVTKSHGHFCMVTEFCEFGSLDDFLREKNLRCLFVDEIISGYENISSESKTNTTFIGQTLRNWATDFKKRREQGKVTTSDLLAFSYQIATGMIFLQEKQILHRDLALRNILLKGDFNIKIADFGLARITKNGAYILVNGDVALPIPQTPPEAGRIAIGRSVSLKADWWTFGVLLWEIFNLGVEKPFKNQSRLSMVNFLEGGNLLNYPKYAPYEIFELMKELWILDPEDRVGLMECQRKLKMQLKVSCPPLVNELIAIDKKIQSQQQEKQAKEQDQHQRTALLQQQHYKTVTATDESASDEYPLIQIGSKSLPVEIQRLFTEKSFTNEEPYSRRFSDSAGKDLQYVSHKLRIWCCCMVTLLTLILLLTGLVWKLVLPNARNTIAKNRMTDCYDWLHIGRNASNGIYVINPTGHQEFSVYCDMKSNGGGWTVFQRRTNASAFDFHTKTWNEYKDGFSDSVLENYWIGNEKLHAVSTKDQFVQLRIDLWTELPGERFRFAEYNDFKVLNATTNYTMTISNMSVGNATSDNSLGSIIYNSGQPFSTIDRNNEGDCFNHEIECPDHCFSHQKGKCEDHCSGSGKRMGGWWMDLRAEKECGYVSLNGLGSGFVWNINSDTSFNLLPHRSEMKLRKKIN